MFLPIYSWKAIYLWKFVFYLNNENLEEGVPIDAEHLLPVPKHVNFRFFANETYNVLM